MISDKFLQVSTSQAVTTSVASTDVIDFKQATPNLGMLSEDMFASIQVVTAAAAAGAATLTISIQDSADGSTFADVAVSPAIPVASLTAGSRFRIKMPHVHRRYVRLYYTVATGPLTAGAFSAGIEDGVQYSPAMPDSSRIA